ncbi:MAG: hypothetical protein ACOYJZ_01115 [Acutalibacter sp.]|jgi:hypothetical protein
MRNLDKLLVSALSQELTDTPPAPVDKRAVKNLTLRKLNLELPQGDSSASQEQWAVPVLRKRRPWAVLAACLVLAVMTGVGVALRPLLLPGAVSLTEGTYLDLSVTQAEFDQESWKMVFTLEATTDLALSSQTEENSYAWWMGVSFSTDVGNAVFRGGQKTLNQLTHWEQVGEDTYRCEGFSLEMLSETQQRQGLYGEQEGTFSLEVTDGMGKTFTAHSQFTITLPEDGPTVSFETSSQVGTSLECSVAQVSFDSQQWAIVLNLQARTDLELSDPSAASRYQWEYALFLHTQEGDQQVGVDENDYLEPLSQWKTAGDYYETVLTIPVDPTTQMEEGLVGTFAATLYLQVTDHSAEEEDPPVFPAQIAFSVTLPLRTTQLSSGTEAAGTYFECSVTEAAFDPQQWAIVLTLEANTDLDLSDPSATTSTRYQWTEIPKLHTPEGDQWVSKESRVSNVTPLAYWESLGDSVYRTTLEYPVDPEVQEESSLVGEFAGTLSLNVRDGSAGEEAEPQVFSAQMDFSVTLPDQSQAQAPEAGTYLSSDFLISPSYEEGVLSMRAAVQTNMDLDNPLAQRYYQWTGELSLTGSGGQSVTLPQTGDPPLEWESISSATSYLYTEGDGYRTVDPLNFPLSNQEYPTEEAFRASYGLEGTVAGTLLLTCQESTSGSPRTWTVRIPVTVELP